MVMIVSTYSSDSNPNIFVVVRNISFAFLSLCFLPFSYSCCCSYDISNLLVETYLGDFHASMEFDC